MIDAQTILKMIEEVDPADTAKLDEIDARVFAYIYGGKAYEYTVGLENEYTVYGVKKGKKIYASFEIKKYTRSRDALKSIRPEGCFIVSECWPQDYPPTYGAVAIVNGRRRFASGSQLTEELAELHAILQAIEFERGNK